MKLNLIFGLGLLMVVDPLMAQNENDNKPAEKVTADNNLTENTAAKTELLDQLTQPANDATSIKVIVQKKQTIEEYRQKGVLVLVKVIPNDGIPYFIDPLERDNLQGSGRDLINSGVKPVRWVLKEF